MANANPIQYTSRSFQTIMNDINSDKDLVDKPEWFKRMMAGIGDVLSMCLDAQANNSYLETAFTRDATKKLCALIGYNLKVQTTSSGELSFYLADNTIFPLTVEARDLCAIYGKISTMRFEARDSAIGINSHVDLSGVVDGDHLVDSGIGTLTELRSYDKVLVTSSPIPDGYYYVKVDPLTRSVWFANSPEDIRLERWVDLTDGTYKTTLYTIHATCYQQEQKSQIEIGSSDGSTPWQVFDLPDTDILQETLQVVINNEEWTRVDNFANSTPISKHFRLDYNNDMTSKIVFGNGTYGQIPDNFPIYVQYAVGGGSDTNINTPNIINVYAGSNSNIEGVSNPYSMQGGSDQESMESAKMLAPMSLKTRDRFVTVEDGIQLLYQTNYVSQATILSNYYGSLSCKVCAIAKGGGNPSADTKLQLQQSLIGRSVLGSLDVRFVDTTFVQQNFITVTVDLGSGYTLDGVRPYIILCIQLYFTECGKEIVDTYQSEGLQRAIEIVNQIFNSSYIYTDQQVANTIEAFVKSGYRKYDEEIYDSPLIALISNCVSGINHLTIGGVTFPITIGNDEISTVPAQIEVIGE